MKKRNRVLGIIPARYGSSRFPGKPLIEIKGMTMIERVYRQCKKARLLDEVIVATDDERIESAVLLFGGKVMMTSTEHQSGTDRCLEVIEKTNELWDVAINIQGDEPLIFPEQIDQLVLCFDEEGTAIATLVKTITNTAEINNPNIVKVVINANKMAMYFSRATIPFYRNNQNDIPSAEVNYYKHIGMYGYRSEILKQFNTLAPSNLEKWEALEQLRWMENGYEIKTALTHYENVSVDVPGDLKMVLNLLP